MAFFQLRSLPGTAWPALPAAEASQMWAAYQQLDRTQWLTPGQLEELQQRQLNVLLDHCFRQVPYYRQVLTQVGLGATPLRSMEEFRRLPLLTRELYQANFDILQARELPAGMRPSGGSFTSGTTGVPIKVLKTTRDGLWWSAFYFRDLEWSGLDPRRRLAAIRLLAFKREDLPAALQGQSTPSWVPFGPALIEMGPAHVMDIRQDPRRQLEWLSRVAPDYLISTPSNLEFLASLLQETGLRLDSLQAIQSFAEPLPDECRQRIEEGFGVPVKNLYSTTETGYVASPCPQGHGLHVHAENVLAEVLDANDRPCSPGQTGRLVLTSLHSFLTPFLRFDILDEVTLAAGPCPCGRGLPLWTHVDGRRLPLLHLPEGGRRSVNGLILGIRQVGGFHQFQVVQRAVDHMVIRVVPDRTWTAEHAGRIRSRVGEEFSTPIRIDVEKLSCLQRPPGGKLQIAIVEMENRAAA